MKKQYQGSCHCQAVKYTCEFNLEKPTMCNCTYCAKRNGVLHIVDALKITDGEGQLTCYRFNKMKGAHYFCKFCGIFIYSTPPEPVYPFAISLCTLDNCSWADLAISYFDGKSL